MAKRKSSKTTPMIKLVKRTLFYRIYLYGTNGRIMLTSEAYYNKGNARRAGVNLHEQTGFPFIDETTLKSA